MLCVLCVLALWQAMWWCRRGRRRRVDDRQTTAEDDKMAGSDLNLPFYFQRERDQ